VRRLERRVEAVRSRVPGRRGGTPLPLPVAPVLRVVLVVVLFAVVGCTPGLRTGADGRTADGRLLVVATTTQLADFARQVGGDRVRVYGVLKANVDAHDYEATPADLDALHQAALVLRNGAGLETWFDRTVRAAEPRGEVLDTSRAVVLRRVDGEEDPHYWMDPANAEVMVREIGAALVRADPAGAPEYERNENGYLRQLQALDVEIRSALAPLENRKVVTNHDAFGYFLDRYGLTFVGSLIPSFDSQAELSSAELSRLVARLRQEQVTAIFAEASLPPKTARVIAAEAGVRVVAGDGSLYADSLGPPGSGADTYLGMMRHDTVALVAGLSAGGRP
jgi:zinc/manganese transport system substrate-binding protein/manganese/iron transport system substrate-binding protein